LDVPHSKGEDITTGTRVKKKKLWLGTRRALGKHSPKLWGLGGGIKQRGRTGGGDGGRNPPHRGIKRILAQGKVVKGGVCQNKGNRTRKVNAEQKVSKREKKK